MVFSTKVEVLSTKVEELLCQGKEAQRKVLAAKSRLEPLDRVGFDRNINTMLKETSKNIQKNISSHTFCMGQAPLLRELLFYLFE
ncbi:hypothetical protein EON70_00995 [bacterium]|nr:MAG: hypothetical protein EON70_00995 [bacterium]